MDCWSWRELSLDRRLVQPEKGSQLRDRSDCPVGVSVGNRQLMQKGPAHREEHNQWAGGPGLYGKDG